MTPPGLQKSASAAVFPSTAVSSLPGPRAIHAPTRLRTSLFCASVGAGVASAGAEVAQIAETSSLALGFAKFSGTAMTAGAALLFSPIIYTMVRNRSGDGISRFTFWLQLIGFSAVFLYNASKGFPIAAYGENISLAVQSLIILILATLFQRKVNLAFFAGLAAYFTWVGLCLFGFLSPAALSVMQIFATVVLT
eukprot:scaffold7236_cov42-Prasinocladus_malaysianus.AAC.2